MFGRTATSVPTTVLQVVVEQTYTNSWYVRINPRPSNEVLAKLKTALGQVNGVYSISDARNDSNGGIHFVMSVANSLFSATQISFDLVSAAQRILINEVAPGSDVTVQAKPYMGISYPNRWIVETNRRHTDRELLDRLITEGHFANPSFDFTGHNIIVTSCCASSATSVADRVKRVVDAFYNQAGKPSPCVKQESKVFRAERYAGHEITDTSVVVATNRRFTDAEQKLLQPRLDAVEGIHFISFTEGGHNVRGYLANNLFDKDTARQSVIKILRDFVATGC